jgi:uncharacterized protein (DUF1800 family)
MQRKLRHSYFLAGATVFCVCSILAGCGAVVSNNGAASAINAASSIRAGETIQVANQSKVTGSPMTYWVNGIQGGNDQVGTIDSNGVYTAPTIVPSPVNNVTITALATYFPEDKPGSATISVLNPVPIISGVNPTAMTEGQTMISVKGSKFVYGAQIVWNGVPVPTVLVSNGELAAQISAPTPGAYPLTVNNPDPGAVSATPVSEQVGPGQVVLDMEPTAGTTVRVNNTLALRVGVTGTSNTGLTWTINGSSSGNALIGTIVNNNDGSVSYTAPAVVPTPNNVVTLKATSVDNPAVSAIQNISVLNPIPLLYTATPMAFDPGPATAVLTGASFINGAQVLVNGSPVSTTFSTSGQLSASFTATNNGNVDLQVMNPSPGPATSTDLIASVNGTPPAEPVSPQDASRFLAQATFGATDSDIHHLSQTGYQNWFNEQFSMQQTLHAPYVDQALTLYNPPCNAGDTKCYAATYVENFADEDFWQQSFWQQALTGPDQLRQRVKYALSEMMVIASTNPAVGAMPRGMANYYDILGADAFGNFRTLLQDVTLNPMMGQFLSMLSNDKGDATRDPDENYAREVMQLFTIGLYQLNPDGTQMLDANGQPIPTYSNNDVMGMAKVLTGFSWGTPGDESEQAWYNCCYWVGPGFGEDLLPMKSFPDHHSTEEKDFLGVSIPESSVPDPDGDLKFALDTLFNHPNLPPFFSKQMIQHLVTSNPSPAYVARVAAVFKDNGQGVRGDMKAVLQAVLLDQEARSTTTDAETPQYGKVREALVRYTEWARAFSAQSRNGSFLLGSTEDPIYGLGEMTLRSPTVFNWFAPGYVPPGTSIAAAGLMAPEMEMTDVSTVVGYLNYMQSSIGSSVNSGMDVYSNYETEMGLAANPDQLLDRINLLLMAGQMDSTLRAQILAATGSIPIPTGDQNAINAALLSRVETAIYLTMASPAYNAQF